MRNTFSQEHVDGINRELSRIGAKAVCKKSKIYRELAVVGIPDTPGSIGIYLEDDSWSGRSIWRCHITNLSPKSLADGDNPGHMEEREFLYWGEVIDFLKKVYR